jgi:dTDP-4-amino-4,6-dideoxygalactose transaminase
LKIPYGRQFISLRDKLAVWEALGADFLTTGPMVENFELRISEIASSPQRAVSVTSGTAALHVAYAAIGVQPGDEVITSPLSFIATASTASVLGAKIVFADIQEDTGNIDPVIVGSLTTSKTKAVTAVDYAGHPADLDELLAITRKKEISLLEDAAHSIGSTYKGRPVGSHADLVAFSFFPTKNATTAEGGALSGVNSGLIEYARSFRAHGLVREREMFQLPNAGDWHQEVHNFGLNYRLPDVLCALGISQLTQLSKFKNRRARVFHRYVEGFRDMQEITLPGVRSYVDPMWHLFPIRVQGNRRRKIFDYLRSKGVMVQVNYMPIYWHPVYRDLGYKKGLCPIAESYYESEISLPMYAGLTKPNQDRVIDLVRKAVSS